MKKNIITFSSSDESCVENYPPLPAGKLIPQWYKEIPPFVPKDSQYVPSDNIGSVKKCMPVLDYMVSGYIIRNPYQSVIKEKIEDTYYGAQNASAKKDFIGANPHHQCPIQLNDKKHHYVKIHQPWLVRTPPGYSSMFFQPHYFFNKDLEILPGVIDTDKFSEPVSLVSILHAPQVILEPGDPLVVVFPFKRESWQMEVKKLNHIPDSIFKFMLLKIWHGTYQKLIHSKKHFS